GYIEPQPLEQKKARLSGQGKPETRCQPSTAPAHWLAPGLCSPALYCRFQLSASTAQLQSFRRLTWWQLTAKRLDLLQPRLTGRVIRQRQVHCHQLTNRGHPAQSKVIFQAAL